ncbi:multicopper oxidase family protein [Kitasatospora sp. LaBMicrA B282]|uniref:multicopper oxidase family protein n=1 Tax=Kitasatospora sp. LaBMicrA B282 TaxID=3420949 RepID=UPI003D12D9B8
MTAPADPTPAPSTVPAGPPPDPAAARPAPAPAGPTDPPRLGTFRDPLPIPPVLRPHHPVGLPHLVHPNGEDRPAELRLQLRSSHRRLHSELPPTPLWTYEGSFPGPTIEVRRGQRLRVVWTNRIDTPFPVVDGTVPMTPPPADDQPGIDPADVDRAAALLPAWTVTHLHGGRTGGGHDGWTENAVLPGESQLAEYPNDQPATLLWYHDHAMGITRLNVQAGLAGLYLVRDEEEDALGLPAGPYEVPLVLCDRNLELGPDGRFTGRLLHKTAAPLPFFGPYTLVNGAIWPYLEVRARWYRFRVLNAANGRAYRLHLVDEQGERVPGAVWQIGTDAGLLGAPVPLPDGGLALTPAERADLLIDFGALAGRTLRLVNSAIAPYEGEPLPPGASPAEPHPDQRLTDTGVLEFRVAREPAGDPFALPARLAPSYTRLSHDALPEHTHRMLLLATDPQGDFQLWEMAGAEPDAAPGAEPTDGLVQLRDATGQLSCYRRVARTFDDTLNWHVRQDGWEVWTILNLSIALHPVHLHLVRFQALSREDWDVSGFRQAAGGTAAGSPVAFRGPLAVAPSDQGWKDTIQVPPGQLVRIAAQFTGATGRFMYHCHLLEHEDGGMMRPFTVTPGAVLDLGGAMPMAGAPAAAPTPATPAMPAGATPMSGMPGDS